MVIDNPPSYDFATQAGGSPPSPVKESGQGVKQPSPSPAAPALQPGPSYGATPGPLVHHYVHPTTGERITSLLPPDHPEMVCLQEGRHIRRTKFGILGVLAAVIWFPLGIGLCLLDRKVTCQRCGCVLDDGIMCG